MVGCFEQGAGFDCYRVQKKQGYRDIRIRPMMSRTNFALVDWNTVSLMVRGGMIL